MISVVVINQSERRGTLQLPVHEHVDGRGGRAVSFHRDSSGNIFHPGVSGHATGLAAGDVSRCVLVKTAHGGCRQWTVLSKDGSGIGVSPVSRLTGGRTLAGLRLQRSQRQNEGGAQHQQGTCKVCFHHDSPSWIFHVVGEGCVATTILGLSRRASFSSHVSTRRR